VSKQSTEDYLSTHPFFSGLDDSYREFLSNSATLGEDQVLGWSWLIPPYRWNFLARAVEESDLLEFDGGAILARCEEDPKFGYELFKCFAALMSERLAAARQKMMDQWDPPGFA